LKPSPSISGILLFLIFSACLIASSSLAGERLVLPEGVYYHRVASLTYGPEATWINPAGLGMYTPLSTQLIGEYYNNKFAKNWGINITGDGIGISSRHLRDIEGEKYVEYTFAAGKMLGRGFYAGGSYVYVEDGPDSFRKKHTWNLGFILRQNPSYSLGAVFRNLNRSRIDGVRSDIEQLYSLSYTIVPRILTFTIESSLSTGQDLSDASYNYSIYLIPMRGTSVYAGIDNNDNFEIGCRVNLTNYFIGFQGRNRQGDHNDATSFYFGVAQGPQESLINPSKGKKRR